MANKRSSPEGLPGADPKRQDDKVITHKRKIATALLDVLRSNAKTNLAALQRESDKKSVELCKRDLRRSTRLDPLISKVEKDKLEKLQSRYNKSSQELIDSGCKDDALANEFSSILVEEFFRETKLVKQQWNLQEESKNQRISELEQKGSSLEQMIKEHVLACNDRVQQCEIYSKRGTPQSVASLVNSTVSEATRAESKKDLDELMAQEVVGLERTFGQSLDEAKQEIEKLIDEKIQHQMPDTPSGITSHENISALLSEMTKLREQMETSKKSMMELEDRVQAAEDVYRHIQDLYDNFGVLSTSSGSNPKASDAHVRKYLRDSFGARVASSASPAQASDAHMEEYNGT